MQTIMLLVFIFIIAAFLGIELISKVPSQLHTPLMSGTNAISGITIVGAIAATAVNSWLAVDVRGSLVSEIIGIILGTLAIFFATINVIGGYFVTDRMLGMFKKKGAK
jgi:NAD(P) transhydrogenase subunit alpha